MTREEGSSEPNPQDCASRQQAGVSLRVPEEFKCPPDVTGPPSFDRVQSPAAECISYVHYHVYILACSLAEV